MRGTENTEDDIVGILSRQCNILVIILISIN